MKSFQSWADSKMGSNNMCCSWAGVRCNRDGRVKELSLTSVDLRGTLPQELGLLDNIEELDIGRNKGLSGTIPPELCRNLLKLDELSVTRTSLEGFLPSTCYLPNIEVLDLKRTSISGTIMPEIGNMTKLKELILSKSELSGTLPTQMAKLKKLEELELESNAFRGIAP